MRKVEDIQKAAWELRSRYSKRDRRYNDAYHAYRGEYNFLGQGYSGDPLKDYGRQIGDKFQVWNLVLPIVDTHRMLLNRLPQIQVPAPIMADQAAADKAERTEKAIYALWDASKMTKKHSEATFNLALYNNTVWFVKWDNDLDLPRITVRQPGECYPMPKRNTDELAYCVFFYQQTASDIFENFPEARSLLSKKDAKGNAINNLIDVIEYIDDKDYVLIVGDKSKAMKVAGSEIDLGFCPVVVTPAVFMPGDLFPPGAIDQMIVLNDYLNRFQTKWGDALESVMFPGVVLEGEGSDQVTWHTGPLAVNKLPEGITYKPVESPRLPQEVFVHLERIEQLMRRIAQFPESASGEMQGSIVTGKAISRLQGVMTGMAAESQANMAMSLQDVNRMVLSMLEKYRPKKKYTLHSKAPIVAMSAPGRNSGQNKFSIEIVPEQHIDGYYESQLFYSPFGSDWNQSLVTGMQMVQSRVASHRWLMNQLPGISDAEGMMREIEEEDERRMRLEVKLQTESQQQIVQAQAQAQMQVNAAQAQNQAPPQGGGGGGEAPPAEAPPGGGGGEGGLGPGSNVLAMPGGRPQAMGTGEPMTGQEGFPLEFTNVKPFNQGLSEIEQMQGGGQTGVEGQALPGKQAVKLADVVNALREAVNRQGQKAIDKLRGKVFIFGDLAAKGYTNGKIDIALTVKSDQQIVTTALRDYAAQNLLRFSILEAGEQPPRPAFDVTSEAPAAATPPGSPEYPNEPAIPEEQPVEAAGGV